MVCLALAIASGLMAQHPIGYGSMKEASQIGAFTFAELDREIVKEKTASFFSETPLCLTFEVLIASNGDVKYVRPPRMEPGSHELRLACTSALYGFVFAALPEGGAEKWYKAVLVWDGE